MGVWYVVVVLARRRERLQGREREREVGREGGCGHAAMDKGQ